MSELEQDQQQQQEGGEAQEQQQEQQQWVPSQEEYESLRSTVEGLSGFAPTLQEVQRLMEEARQQQEQEELQDLDIDQYIEMKVQERLAPILPVVNTAAQRTGQERMKALFDEEKETVGDFDYKLAERVAHSYFAENPNDPVKAVKEAAKYAAEVRAAERKAGGESFKERLRGGGAYDLPVSGGGNHTVPPAKSYDEVIERKMAETEV